MNKGEILKMAREAGVYSEKWRYGMLEEQNALADLVHLAVAAERERCIGIIHGQCGSDNVAQRTVDAIRSQS